MAAMSVGFLGCLCRVLLRLQSRATLIEIDHHGERLVGCVECNRWGRPGDKRLVMELMEEDIEALRYWRRA